MIFLYISVFKRARPSNHRLFFFQSLRVSRLRRKIVSMDHEDSLYVNFVVACALYGTLKHFPGFSHRSIPSTVTYASHDPKFLLFPSRAFINRVVVQPVLRHHRCYRRPWGASTVVHYDSEPTLTAFTKYVVAPSWTSSPRRLQGKEVLQETSSAWARFLQDFFSFRTVRGPGDFPYARMGPD